jgi:hypothetical protein
LFLLLKTSGDISAPLPQGQAAAVNNLPAVLRTGPSGSVAPPAVPEGAKTVTVFAGGSTEAGAQAEPSPQGEPSAGNGEAGLRVDGGTAKIESGAAGSPTDVKGAGLRTEGAGPEMPSISYSNAKALTWNADGTRVELLSNLPVAELQKIAEGMVLTK